MTTFQTPQFEIQDLLKQATDGRLQLPDFQRPYRWDDERIRSLLVTILRGHPMGVIMTLRTGGESVRFKPRPVTGVDAADAEPELLLLDGQQRVTSLVQALTGDGIVDTEDERHHKLQRRYFIDVRKALGDPREQDEAILSLPASGIVTKNIGRDIELDVSTEEKQHERGLMPISILFTDKCFQWLLTYMRANPDEAALRTEVVQDFQERVFGEMRKYQIPAIELSKDISKEAVATVFEKVNTGGLRLDTFELLTSTFAGDRAYFDEHGEDFRLAEDWEKTGALLDEHPAMKGLRTTDFLMGVSVLVTLKNRLEAIAATPDMAKPPQTSARREDILSMSLEDYLDAAPKLRSAIPAVDAHLRSLHIHRDCDVPYRSQIVSLLILHALLGRRADEYAVRKKLNQWFWCGVLGELYGATIESKLARDAEQVPDWALGSKETAPEIVTRASFAESRLGSLRTRNAAAYKGIYALLMAQEPACRDWMTDHVIDHSTYGDLSIDIHHVFPKKWCERNGIDPSQRESIINKTPLAKRTNIRLGGVSPAKYMAKLDAALGDAAAVDATISSHRIDPALLRSGDFDGYFRARREALVALIENAMGKPVARDWAIDADDTDAPENFTLSIEEELADEETAVS